MSPRVGDTAEEVECRTAALLQYASVMGAFYKAMTDNSMPSELAGDLVHTWWESALARKDDDE